MPLQSKVNRVNLKLYTSIAILFIGLLLTNFTSVLPVQAQETDIFRDNFEAYAVGTFPSAGGWEIVWDGMGKSYQVISTSYSYSPTKSLQLWGTTGWSAVVQRKFTTDSPIIGYELSILIDERSSGYQDHPAFFCKEAATWGAYYGAVLFDHSDGKIKAENGVVLGSWSPRTWYKIKVVLDRQSNKYSVWINGELKGQNIPTSRSDTNRINAISLVSGWPGKKVYYDDVRVFTVTQQNYYLGVKLNSATLNGQTISTSNPELRVAPSSKITGTVTFTVENVQPGSWITPVIWVTSWERGTVANGKVRVVTNDIRTTQQFTINIDVTAPSSPGTYYIGFFAGWMYNPDEVASNDHPPNYGDGDDVWDMRMSDWESVIKNGQAPEGAVYRMPGRAIRVIVQEEYYLKVDFSRAVVNGQPLGIENPEISIQPGAKISGFLEVIVNNKRGGPWITPVIGTVSWGRQLTGQSKGWFVTITSDAPTGTSTQRFEFSLTAPTAPGTYYIGIFTGWMYSGEEVASNDHPPQFGDGDDVWDMKQSDWESIIKNGQAPDGAVYRMPGRAIRVIVLQEIPLPDLTVSRLDVPPSATPGETITISFTEANIGKAHAGFHYDKVEVIPPLWIPEKKPLIEQSIPHEGLGAEASVTRSITFLIPSGTPPGTYIVRVTVDATNQVQESNETNNVREASIEIKSIPIKIIISANPTSGKAPLTVQFTASPSGGIPPYSYKWDFGDGETSTEQNPSRTYTKAGDYVVTCTVRDSMGSQSTAEITIKVEGETGVTLSFQPSKGNVAPGGIYEVEVVISQVSKLDTAIFTLSFNPSVLEFVEAKAGKLMPNAEVASNIISPGKVKILVSQPLGVAGVTGSGSIVIVRLKAVGSSGSSTTLSLLDVSLADSDGNAIKATTIDGSVTIGAPSDNIPPSVTVVSPNGGEVWPSNVTRAIKWTASDNVGVTKVDIFYSTDGGKSWIPVAQGIPNTGSYDWRTPNITSVNCLIRVDAYDAANNKGSDTSNAPFTIVLKGDMNRNGKLDTGDATILLRKVVGLEPILPEDILIGDMNGTNALDTGDATIILRKVVGL
ncbi:MAG: PKD domain-containing protein [archaeon YNP-LCB-003-016]|uniref:PKD domain-containing protein n=1 Tax=Candidatus Culexarchaeum yellowstonense TaxID=2928963 RepID=UPI0026EFE347|nr:PKD domain-containing protein [Candidatus Culexarchaeum yellowstonense]MCR6692027.1 PKD domain-containing protein [Candidatus Culexarchaeum yellowstonense]